MNLILATMLLLPPPSMDPTGDHRADGNDVLAIRAPGTWGMPTADLPYVVYATDATTWAAALERSRREDTIIVVAGVIPARAGDTLGAMDRRTTVLGVVTRGAGGVPIYPTLDYAAYLSTMLLNPPIEDPNGVNAYGDVTVRGVAFTNYRASGAPLKFQSGVRLDVHECRFQNVGDTMLSRAPFSCGIVTSSTIGPASINITNNQFVRVANVNGNRLSRCIYIPSAGTISIHDNGYTDCGQCWGVWGSSVDVYQEIVSTSACVMMPGQEDKRFAPVVCSLTGMGNYHNIKIIGPVARPFGRGPADGCTIDYNDYSKMTWADYDGYGRTMFVEGGVGAWSDAAWFARFDGHSVRAGR
jgi:hypothetical protein